MRYVLIALVTCAACSSKQPPREKTATREVHAFSVTSLGEPVRAARAWTSALAPNARGGWNFITQTWENGSTQPTEFIVLDLETGHQKTFEGPTGIYANSNYQVAEQLRAQNGRIFFPMGKGYLAYYEPSDESVRFLGKVVDGDDAAVFRMVFGPDGKLYGGTQAGARPAVFTLDPDTLVTHMIGRVGTPRATYSYAYYLAADPPWLYVAVGEDPWELVAIHITTGEERVLATRADAGWMELEPRANGITAKLISGLRTPAQKTELVSCVDGRIGDKPSNHAVTPRENPIAGAPVLDLSAVNPDADGIGRVRWGGRETTYHVKYTEPVEIESLVALADGTLLGNASQYHGFFRYDPKTKKLAHYGSVGISRGPRATLAGITYLAGYPSSVLFAFDPKRPWSAKNPRKLGNFFAAGTHYASALVPAKTGRLYFSGRRERTGVGGGVGYYEPGTGRFAGHHERLEMLDPEGLVVLENPRRVIYSGHIANDPTNVRGETAQLVVFDENLVEQKRLTVKPGLRNTGAIYATPDPRVLIGVISEPAAIYQYDVVDGRLLAWRALDRIPGPIAQRDDASLWYVLGDALYRVDPVTLAETRVGTLPETANGAGLLTWLGDRLYWSVSSRLREIAAPLSE
jgi:hypothetical protein